jgi:hypothetical protein
MRAWRNHLETWWQGLVQPEKAGRIVLGVYLQPGFDRFLIFGIVILYALYGLSMGLFRGGPAAVVSGLKLPFLYIFSLIICFLPLYVLNCLLGPKLRFRQCLRLLLIAISANAAALASYAPFSLFFTLTTSRNGYVFLVLMHVAVFGISGVLSILVIRTVFRATAAMIGRKLRFTFVIAWGVLYAFVGTQMSWILRPWIGSWDVPYAPFRPIEGSFIEALWDIFTKYI